MIRHIALTVIAAVFFIVGMVLYLQNRGTSNDGPLMLGAILIRCGIVMGVISLSLKQVQEFFAKYPPWLVGGAGLSLLVIVVRPQAIIIIGPLIGILMIVQFWGWLMTPPTKGKKKQPPPS